MGHYDSCRDGYCAGCGAAPGNLINGKCPFCESRRNMFKKYDEEKAAKQPKLVKVKDNKPSEEEYKKALDIVKRYEKNK